MRKKTAAKHALRTKSGRRDIRNTILLRLSASDRHSVVSKVQFVDLPTHTVLCEVGRPMEFVYFIDGGLASVLAVMANGKSVEVGLAGKEGFIGLPILAGFESGSTRVVMQVGGSAHRMSAASLKKLLVQHPQLKKGLFRHAQEMALQAEHIAACNRLHEVDERLARWLLMSHDRLRGKIVPLTQQYLSHMLGTRRASVSMAAAVLQKVGAISYSRGNVTINDRRKLEAASCECYGKINRQLQRWEAESK